MQSVKVHRQEAAKEPQVACIRLTRGSADDSVWVLEEGVGGTFLTVGSDPECDWQVRAAGVMPQALFVLLIGGMVYVRSGPARGVRLDGSLLSEDWTHVAADARLDIGMATLEIKLAKDALLPSLREVPVPVSLPAQRSVRSAQPVPSEHERSGMRRSVVPRRDPPRAPRLDARAVVAERAARQRAEWQRRAELAAARQRSGSSVWTYLIGGVALAGAYMFWLAWLD